MSVRVGINGFGRVGRCFMRAAHEQSADLEVVAVNDLTDAATLAQLLKYDSVYGRFPGEVRAVPDAISIDGVAIPALAQTDRWMDLEASVMWFLRLLE